jgi:hypothetical protein
MSLVFNIFPYYVSSYFVPYTPDKISVTPKFSSPKLFLQLREFSKYFSRRYTLEYLHYLRGCISRRYFHKYVHMILHYFHCVYTKLIFFGNLSKYIFQVLRNLTTHYPLSVLWDPYQMIFQIIYSVFCPFYAHAIFISPCKIFDNGQTRLSANHFHPASKLTGIQWCFL